MVEHWREREVSHVAVRSFVVEGRTFYEALLTLAHEGPESGLQSTGGLIVDARGVEVATLDAEGGVANFAPSPSEQRFDERLSAWVNEHFSLEALREGELEPMRCELPAALDEGTPEAPDDADAFGFEFEGRRYVARVTSDEEPFIAVYDDRWRALGATLLSESPLVLESPGETLPWLGAPQRAAHRDGFDGPVRKKLF